MSPVANCRYTCREAKWRWQTTEILKHGNRRTCAEKGQDLMKTLDLIFQCFDSFSDPSLRRTKWKMEFTITACRGCSLHMNSQSFPGERSSIKFLSGTPHKPGSEWWQWSQYLCSVHSWNKVQLNASALRNYLCSGWLPNMTQQLQTSQCETSIPKNFSTIHSAFVEVGSWSSRSRNQTSCLTVRSGWDMARSLHLTWTAACANTTTAAGSQWFQGWKHGNQVYLGCVQFNIAVQIEGWKKNDETWKNKAGPFTRPFNRVPQRHEALAIWFATGIRFQPRLKKGLWSLKWYQNWSAIQMTWRCFYSLPICSHFKSTLIFMKLCYSSLHGDSCCFRKTFFRSTGQSEHKGPFASPGLAN